MLGIAVGLAMDAFAVSVAAGLTVRPITPRHVFRLAFHFGLFQALMPILGWAAGKELASAISAYDHWAAFGLLAFVGGKMLWEARREGAVQAQSDPTRGLTLVALSVATSIDALAVGLSMGFMQISVWLPAAVIGVVAAALTVVGFRFGASIGLRWGRWAEAVGGCVLLFIGVKILVSHLSA